jgi:endonuclease YncB( thermonuclease family)
MKLDKKLVAAAVTAVITGTAAVTIPYLAGEKVTQVIDGDTFVIQSGAYIRLSSIDAPEMGRCGSQEAKKQLAKLVLGKNVHLRQPIGAGRRVIAWVYADGKLVNTEMIKAGWAVSDATNGIGAEEMAEAINYARDNKIGIFGPACSPETPPNPKCNIKGNRNETRNWAAEYLTINCRYYSNVKMHLFQGDEWFCSEAEAKKAGFVKAESCR